MSNNNFTTKQAIVVERIGLADLSVDHNSRYCIMHPLHTGGVCIRSFRRDDHNKTLQVKISSQANLTTIFGHLSFDRIPWTINLPKRNVVKAMGKQAPSLSGGPVHCRWHPKKKWMAAHFVAWAINSPTSCNFLRYSCSSQLDITCAATLVAERRIMVIPDILLL